MQDIRQQQLTHAIVMVRPIDFGFNEQTGQDNEFQHRPKEDEKLIQVLALREFDAMVEQIESHKIDVTVLGKNHTSTKLPDAVFPNNWFSTRADGSLIIYPMKTPNRQAEVQVEQLVNQLSEKQFEIKQLVDLRQTYQNGQALEGTGSLIFHHPTGQLFAAVSERCEFSALRDFATTQGYRLQWFETRSSHGKPIYHTNVLMSCGEDFAVIAKDVLLANDQSQSAINALAETTRDLIMISEEQMSNNFCGNIIQLKNRNDSPCIVMSTSALNGFTQKQLGILEKHGDIVACDIPTIEHIGGGSARCMIAENFLPNSPQ
ncbi:hypothetical protein FLL45_15555 [Aliikangiella marina]|uniref:Amidinotransferase n=1 Tax=Aliikangiella marina TaxID=1712262 RepID=A0A545T6M6_9GAMM|nr:arginine deiminase-related protein [Aliikangiella marina]TQV72880.1 hypothetical protein FLL45_15555 [Aliikangiella marina]